MVPLPAPSLLRRPPRVPAEAADRESPEEVEEEVEEEAGAEAGDVRLRGLTR